MLKDVSDLTAPGAIKGLNTQYNILALQKDQSPNMMNIQVNYDGTIAKRLGTNTQNSTVIANSAGASFTADSNMTLLDGLVAYWKLNEPSGPRSDSFGDILLYDSGGVSYSSGIKSQAAYFKNSASYLYATDYSMLTGRTSHTVSTWVYLASTSTKFKRTIYSKLNYESDTDPYNMLLLHCEGADSSRKIVDSSSSGKVVISTGVNATSGVWVDSANYLFGSGGLRFNVSKWGTATTLITPVSGGYLSIADSPDWDFGTGDYCIDFRAKGMPGYYSGQGNIWNPAGGILVQGYFFSRAESSGYLKNTLSSDPWVSQEFLSMRVSMSQDQSSWVLSLRTGDTSGVINTASLFPAPTTGNWYHFALTRSSGYVRLFFGGSCIYFNADCSNIVGTKPFLIGQRSLINSTSYNMGIFGSAYFRAQNDCLKDSILDEFRIVKGTPKYVEDFVPPLGDYGGPNNYEEFLFVETDNIVTYRVSSDGYNVSGVVRAVAGSALKVGSWYNVVAYHSENSSIGVGVNNYYNSSAYTLGIWSGSAPFVLGAFNYARQASQDSQGMVFMHGRIDETGYWGRSLTDQEKTDIYNNRNGSTYNLPFNAYPWASFDFGASSFRWLVAGVGTGVYASSDLGVNWIEICTDRTATYQYYDRSKNVLVMTSDAQDVPLYWSGSGGTSAVAFENSAPQCKFNINFQGFLILLNSNVRKRSFNYIDENFQLTSTAWLNFDIPSSADDEITGAFILRRYLYISTRYKIFRVSYVGGNPDWQYVEVKNWGFLPRTAKKIVLTNFQQGQNFSYSIGEVVVGMSYDKKLRIFDGSGDQLISNNVEKDNGICEFALDKISLFGSGPVISFAEVDQNQNVYKICLAIGENSSQTTHMLNYDGRTQAMYPYNNMPYNCMCMAESANIRYLMAFDRSGYCHIMDSGNLDASTTPVDDYFESPVIFDKTPSQSTKGHKSDLYFSNSTSGDLYYEDHIDFDTKYTLRRRFVVSGSTRKIVHVETIDIPETYNAYQFRLSSSMGTSDPWRLQRYDHFTQGLGIGRNDG